MNLAYTLLNNGQAEQARAVAEKLAASATRQRKRIRKRLAKSVLEAIAEEDEWEKSGVQEGVTRDFAPPGEDARNPGYEQLRFRRRVRQRGAREFRTGNWVRQTGWRWRARLRPSIARGVRS